MWGWMSGRPRQCLKVGVESVAWAEAQWDWRGGRGHRCVTSPLPEGAVKPSPAEPNLAQLTVVEAKIQALVGPPQDVRILGHVVMANCPRPVTLLLPDAAVRAVVLHLDQLPARADEREALIRWRFGQEQLFPLTGTTLISQVFSGSPRATGAAQSVLAVAIHQSVLRQYESVCESVGLVPRDVGLTSLRLFDLWVKMAGRTGWEDEDLLWISLVDRALTAMVFQQGRLLFYRCKLLTADALSGADTGLQKIAEECAASVEMCQQRHSGVSVKHAVLCADDMAPLHEKLEEHLALSVESLGWEDLESRGWGGGGYRQGVDSLAALAGVLS
ncbi:MAG TPA: hypothetical protein VF443_05565 [Nitrospira sp.]